MRPKGDNTSRVLCNARLRYNKVKPETNTIIKATFDQLRTINSSGR